MEEEVWTKYKLGVGPSQARLGPARLVSIREKKLGKARLGDGSKIFGSKVARLEIGSKNFGSQLGSARSDLARWLASQTRALFCQLNHNNY